MTSPAFRHPIRFDALASRKPTRFDLRPDAAARATIAAELGLPAITALRFRGELAPRGRRDWQLSGRLEASVTQSCVVTLAPVPAEIAEPVERRYLADLPDPEGEEVEMPDETVEPLVPEIDLGAVMIEALTLALPPFPRAEGVGFEGVEAAPPGVAPLGETEPTRPFAGLADLLRDTGKDPQEDK